MLVDFLFFFILFIIVAISYFLGFAKATAIDTKHIIDVSNNMMINYLIDHGFLLTSTDENGNVLIISVANLFDSDQEVKDVA